jgi:hypothetical protein
MSYKDNCIAENCEAPQWALKYCTKHYQRFKKYGDLDANNKKVPSKGKCAIDDCETKASRREWCDKHYARWRNHGDPNTLLKLTNGTQIHCSVQGCERLYDSSGYCRLHYWRVKNHGSTDTPKRTWKGNRTTSAVGHYVRIKDPTGKRKKGILEHRYVMGQYLGRELLSSENVHHKNGVRNDNRIENLELWTTSQPQGQRVTDKLEWAYEIIALYEKEKNKWQ